MKARVAFGLVQEREGRSMQEGRQRPESPGRGWSEAGGLLTRAVSEEMALASHPRTLVPKSLGHWWCPQESVSDSVVSDSLQAHGW